MFTYYKSDNKLNFYSTQNDKVACQNNFSKFKAKKYSKISIDGEQKGQAPLEFILRSYQLEIEELEIDNCIIDLSKAQGQFYDIKFKNCYFKGDLKDKFKALCATFYTGITLSQLKCGQIRNITVLREYSRYNTVFNKLSFDGAQFLRNLTDLRFFGTEVDLSNLCGSWDSVKLTDCTFQNIITDKFSAQNCEISSRTQDFLTSFKDHNFHNLIMKIGQNRDDFNCQSLNNIQWRQLNLTLINLKVDLTEFKGKFNDLCFNQCTFLGNGYDQLICYNLTVYQCDHLFSPFGTQLFRNIRCTTLNISNCLQLNCIPRQLIDLNVNSTALNLRNSSSSLKSLILTGTTEIIFINVTKLLNLDKIEAETSKNSRINGAKNFILKRKAFINKTQQNKTKIINLSCKINKIQKNNLKLQKMVEHVVEDLCFGTGYE
ncbi:Hypothetical_protein [Hexamita inflata]|uniref:Hypothetical_protein n=1 Tax=Hexamita inflata TaxID=28002 RepID=A0AA86NB01_9EUKA|nr:Hypothetical protein HINF_LOCUS3650 [Hexamita inflata]